MKKIKFNWPVYYKKLVSYHILIFFWIGIYCLIILQDYIFSYIQQTGFYWSEATLFNSFWLFFIPTTILTTKLAFFFGKINSKWIRLTSIVCYSLIFSILHILVFTCFFIGLSKLLFSPAHHFSGILNSLIANDFYLTTLVYFLIPIATHIPKRIKKSLKEPINSAYATFLSIKKDNKLLQIEVSTILFISSNKPYSQIHTNSGSYLINLSLTKLEKVLDPDQFLRVHRSTLVNKSFIKEIKSRKNGDYDVLLDNKTSLRLSRHYRQNWENLIFPST